MNRNLEFVPLLLACGLVLGGCRGNATTSYVPKSDSAQEAVKLVLEAWKNGQPADPAGKLSSGATVRGIDADWAAGKKLASYEILQEAASSGEGPRKIPVKLTYAGAQPIDATYFVVGIDPLQVIRDKDYEKYFGMQ